MHEVTIFLEIRFRPAQTSSGQAEEKQAEHPKPETPPAANLADPSLFWPMDWNSEPNWHTYVDRTDVS
jgi:hypothetical protein